MKIHPALIALFYLIFVFFPFPKLEVPAQVATEEKNETRLKHLVQILDQAYVRYGYDKDSQNDISHLFDIKTAPQAARVINSPRQPMIEQAAMEILWLIGESDLLKRLTDLSALTFSF